jgi:hypothetical protein
MGGEGLELPKEIHGKTNVSKQSDAKSDAVDLEIENELFLMIRKLSRIQKHELISRIKAMLR